MYKQLFFDRDRFLAFIRTLPDTGHTQNQVFHVPEPVAIMTHDDHFDAEMFDWERAHGYEATWFLLSDEIGWLGKALACNADIQLHQSMERPDHIIDQIGEFVGKVGKPPTANRNHRAFVRAPHLDLTNLSMNGIRVDSTLQYGHDPYRICVQGRLVPCWELPFQVVDVGFVDATQYCHPVYNLAPMETLFEKERTPIVGLFHPYLKAHTRWQDFFALAEKYDYTVMTVSQFYEKYLRGAPC